MGWLHFPSARVMSIVSSINFNTCKRILEIDRQRRLRGIGVILSVELDVYHSLRGKMIEYPYGTVIAIN